MMTRPALFKCGHRYVTPRHRRAGSGWASLRWGPRRVSLKGSKGPVALIISHAAYLPERVKLLAIRDGELPCLVLVNAVVQHFALM